MALMRDARHAYLLPRGSLRPLGRALLELALARLRLKADHSDLLLRAKASRQPLPTFLTDEQARLAKWIAFALPRVAHRVPWRADCLVQAIAGERWLRSYGIPSHIVIGVKKSGLAPLSAHAWLEAGGQIVTGGDITTFVPLAD